jgi:hypothetical protein
MLENYTTDFHSVMYPLCYDTSALVLEHFAFDTSTFTDPGTWSFFERDTVMDGFGRILFYAYTLVPASGVPTGIQRIGSIEFEPVVPPESLLTSTLDTCHYPPEGHLYYSNYFTGDCFPLWTSVDVQNIIQCGDANWSGFVTPSDGYQVLNYLGSGPPPASCWASNADGNDGLTPSDAYWKLNYLGVGPELECVPCDLIGTRLNGDIRRE